MRFSSTDSRALFPTMVGAFLLLALGRTALAADPGRFECKTTTPRPAAEVLVPLADAESPFLPEKGIAIERGETLCITGQIAADGSLRSLRLFDHGPQNGIMLRIQFTGGRLVLQSNASQPVQFRTADMLGPISVARPTEVSEARSWVIHPGESFEQMQPTTAKRLLVFGPVIRELPAPRPDAVRFPALVTGPHAPAFALVLYGGSRGMKLDGLDGSLRRYGFSSPGTNVPIFSGAFELQALRFRIGLDVTGGRREAHSSAGSVVSISHSEVGPTLSYDFIQHESFAAFVSTGLLFGSVNADSDVGEWPEFDDRLRNQRERLNGVTRSYKAVPAELGGEYRLGLGRSSGMGFALLFQYRLGYVFQVSSGDWKTRRTESTEERWIGGGPSIMTSGPRARLGLAFALTL